MTIVELALINIRHFKEAKKILLKPGFNLLQGGNGAGKSTLFNVFRDIFFPDYEAYPPDGSSQGAISFKLDNGEIYRLLRNFSKHSVQLYKLDPGANKFSLIEKEPTQIQNLLFSYLKLENFSKEMISSFFFIGRSSLPSQSPLRRTRPASAVAMNVEKKIENPSNLKNTLEELKKEEAKADLLAQKESEMLDYKDKIFSIKRTLNELETVESGLLGLSEKEKIFSGFSTVPKDIGQIIDDYEKAILEKNSEEQQLIEEKEFIEQQLSMDQQNLLQNKFLWAGGMTVAIFLLLPFFLDLDGVLKQIDLIGLLAGIGLALFSLIKDFNKISQRKVWNTKLENKNKNIEMLNARFNREHVKYFGLLQKTNSASREEFETKLSVYRQLKEEEGALLQKKQSLLVQKSKETLLSELKESSEKADLSEKEINKIKPGTKDPYVIQQEIKTLEESLAAGNASFSLESGSLAPEEGISLPTNNASGSISTFLENDWDLLLKHCGLDLVQMNQVVQKIVHRIAGDRFEIQIAEQGMITLNPPQETLSPGTLDQIFWSLVVFRLELLRNITFPLFLDDPLVTIDPARQALIIASLRDLSKGRQVIFLSNTPYPVESANLIKL
ncbi:MAG: AAA family ATPase [Nitrospirae bacterium]|nr:AAA family ATPase [Nitrospirota bacterium]